MGPEIVESSCGRVVAVQTAVVGSYPQNPVWSRRDAVHYVIIQGICPGGLPDVLEAVAKRMPVIDSSEISPEPHPALIVPQDASDRISGNRTLTERVAPVTLESVCRTVIYVKTVESSHPDSAIRVGCDGADKIGANPTGGHSCPEIAKTALLKIQTEKSVSLRPEPDQVSILDKYCLDCTVSGIGRHPDHLPA